MASTASMGQALTFCLANDPTHNPANSVGQVCTHQLCAGGMGGYARRSAAFGAHGLAHSMQQRRDVHHSNKPHSGTRCMSFRANYLDQESSHPKTDMVIAKQQQSVLYINLTGCGARRRSLTVSRRRQAAGHLILAIQARPVACESSRTMVQGMTRRVSTQLARSGQGRNL